MMYKSLCSICLRVVPWHTRALFWCQVEKMNIQIFSGFFIGIHDNSVAVSSLLGLVLGFLMQTHNAQSAGLHIGVALQNNTENDRNVKGTYFAWPDILMTIPNHTEMVAFISPFLSRNLHIDIHNRTNLYTQNI